MADFKVNILGCGSATPSLRHMPSCQVVDHRDRLMMVDCGEGAQLAMRRMRLKYSRLNNIFISHLHGDHCLGLPGLLSTMALHDIEGTVTVHTFAEGAELFERIINFFCRERSYDLRFNIIKPEHAVIYEDKSLSVETFPLYHRVPCVGYIFREKPKLRHINREMVDFYKVPVAMMHSIKEGADFVLPDGTVVANERLTTPAEPAYSYAYCSDTVYNPLVAEAVKGVDVVYHEATYTDDDAEKARQRGHSTAGEAAKIALEAGAKKLIIGHYSKSYADESGHIADACRIFPDTIAANEGLTIDIS
ncbi:MAG: ribonuclease Z [Bacteroidales bacterium 43_36]|nr:MAG: ribonuclease Z [Bacteroidales bacterium 43_36]